MAFYAGLDVSDLTTAICVIDRRGARAFEVSVSTTPAAIASALKPYRRTLEKVGHESGSKAPWLQKELIKRKLPMVCLDARITHGSLAAQRNKTDKNDARALAQVLRSGWYTTAYVKSDEALRLRLLLTHRKTLKHKAVSIQHSIRVSLKVFGAQIDKKGDDLIVRLPSRSADPMVERLIAAMLRARAGLMTEIKAMDAMVAKITKGDSVCRRLMTVPGVGPLTALAFRAAVDDPQRFSSSRKVAAYFGLTPKRLQSGASDFSGRVSKMGDTSVRTALNDAAFAMLTVSRSKCALRSWGLRLRKKNGLAHARAAVARKLAVILHRLWVSGRNFNPNLSERPA
jgi:transposase